MDQADWTICHAAPADRSAVRLLLPGIDALLDEPTIIVATLSNPRRIIGAAAVWEITARTKPTTVPCDISVGVPWQRHGIGRALLSELEKTARAWGAQAMGSVRPVQRQSPAHAGWLRLGFADTAILRSYSADIAALFGRHMELYDWCVATGRASPHAHTFRPGPEHSEAIARLNAQALGGMAWHMIEGFRAVAGTEKDVSLAVGDGDRMAGFILTRVVSPDTLHVHSHVIAPAYRQGWAQALLHRDFMQMVTDAGYKRFTFEAGDAHPVTQKTAARVGATLVAEKTMMIRGITG